MSARGDLIASMIGVETATLGLFKGLGEQLRASVERHAESTPDGVRITPLAQKAIMRDAVRILERVYPTRKGGPCALERVILRNAVIARQKPIDAEVATMRKKLAGEPEILNAMRRHDAAK